jgi:hypothetical protein
MGLDYSYLLYFRRERIWDVLQGVTEIAVHHHPPARIHFPDQVLSIPLDTWSMRGQEIQHDAPEFGFSTVLLFEEDDAILDYILSRDQGKEDFFRGPPDPDGEVRIAIGYIYLTIYQKNPFLPTSDLVLFDFGTTGTRMSLLFDESTSIRRTFTKFLSDFQGVCGVFNREDNGELFWLKGKELDKWIQDPFLMPEEIEKTLGERRDGLGDDH